MAFEDKYILWQILINLMAIEEAFSNYLVLLHVPPLLLFTVTSASVPSLSLRVRISVQ